MNLLHISAISGIITITNGVANSDVIEPWVEDPWSLRRIATLKDLTFAQQYTLMMDLQEEGKLDDATYQLVSNLEFENTWFLTNSQLAEGLNELGIEKLEDVPHAAAVALMLDEIEVYNSLVPYSSAIILAPSEGGLSLPKFKM